MSQEVKNFDFSTGEVAESQIVGHFDVKVKIGSEIVEHGFDIRPLKDTHVAYLVRAAQRKRNESAIISAVINFMEYALTEESSARFEEIVLGDPGLSMMQVVEIFQYVLGVVSSGAEAAPAKKPRSRSGNPAVRAAG